MKEMNDCQKIEDIWKVGSYISEKKDEENIIPYKEKHYNYVRSPILLTEEKNILLYIFNMFHACRMRPDLFVLNHNNIH